MFPIIEVECPFCKATGQIVAPPLGSIIVGPCPRCSEMVLLFNGSVMPLDKDIINGGTADEKKQHLLETIVELVADRVDELVESGDVGSDSVKQPGKKGKPLRRVKPSVSNRKAPPISRDDVRDFINIDLHLIDTRDYFEKVFGKTRKKRTE
ncbi:MAG: hypothetical protein Kow0099_24150 [Candidatus Abyssubacteria bacterium]